MSAARLQRIVGEAVAEGALWSRGDRVAVAVSGGIDSVVLLDVLCETSRWHGGQLSVVSVDHGTREGSADDLRFVCDLAQHLGLPIRTETLSLAARSEGAMRDARYAIFESLTVERVALAHHRDDLAETMLFRAIRGTGSTGLAAMRPARGRYVRPMLSVSRKEIREYAALRGLSFAEDPTNHMPIAARNRLRNEVLPLLEQIRPGAASGLARSAGVAARDDELLSALLDERPDASGPPWQLTFVASAPEPLVRRALIRAVPGLGVEITDAVRAIARAGRGQLDAPGGRFVIEGQSVTWSPTPR